MKKPNKNLKNKKTVKPEKIKIEKQKTKPVLKFKKKRPKRIDENMDDLLEYEDHLVTEEDFEEELELSLKKRLGYDEEEETEEVEDAEEAEEVVEPEEVLGVPFKNKRPKVPKEKFYVDPKQFDDEIVKYYESGVISNILAEMVSKIANKLSYSSNFAGYTYREEMVGDGIVRMFKALMSKKYDREKGTNPFSYFTRIAFNAFRNRIKKEKHIHEAQERYQQEYMMVSEGYANLLKNNQISITKDIMDRYD
jgi:hypothetical protein